MQVATLALGARLEQIAAEYLRDRYSGPGNPMGTRLLDEPPVLATRVPFVPGNNQMNGAHGVTEVGQFHRVAELYEDQPFWLDVTPATSPALLAALGPAGFRPESFTSALHASPVPQPAEHSVDIQLVGPESLELFLDTINLGFGLPQESLAALRSNQSFWCDIPHWRLLLARVDGEPAGAATLSIHGDTGYLAAGATLPAFQRRGVHAALIAERLKLAAESGCTGITGQADAGSTSQCNQQRAGLGIVHTKCIWTNRPEGNQ